jgi:hypothetical protein
VAVREVTRPAESLEQLARGNLQCLGQLIDCLQCDVLFRTFDSPDVRPVQAATGSECFL